MASLKQQKTGFLTFTLLPGSVVLGNVDNYLPHLPDFQSLFFGYSLSPGDGHDVWYDIWSFLSKLWASWRTAGLSQAKFTSSACGGLRCTHIRQPVPCLSTFAPESPVCLTILSALFCTQARHALSALARLEEVDFSTVWMHVHEHKREVPTSLWLFVEDSP